MQAAVTTSREDEILVSKAKTVAAELKLEYIPRRKKSLALLLEEFGLDLLVVVEKERVILKGLQTEYFWHPSMAVPRLKSLRSGGEDPMVCAMGLQEGFQVLDCTLGLAADALVASYAIGPTGHVTGLEASPYIAYITACGLKGYNGHNRHLAELTDRISVIRENYTEYLRRTPDNTFEVVYFDPMFSRGLHRSSAINAIRSLAYYGALPEQSLREALRVAKFRVVMKDHGLGEEISRLKPDRMSGGRYSPVVYGVWEK